MAVTITLVDSFCYLFPFLGLHFFGWFQVPGPLFLRMVQMRGLRSAARVHVARDSYCTTETSLLYSLVSVKTKHVFTWVSGSPSCVILIVHLILQSDKQEIKIETYITGIIPSENGTHHLPFSQAVQHPIMLRNQHTQLHKYKTIAHVK